MSYLYLTKSTYKLGFREGQLTIFDLSDSSERTFPFAKIDGLSVYGSPQLSTQLIKKCIENDVAIQFYSSDGHYFGHLASWQNIDPARQKQQVLLTEDPEFCLQWAKQIVAAKIKNSLTLLESMSDVYAFEESDFKGMKHSLAMLDSADSIDMVMGFEGNAAKCYFKCLPHVVDEAFRFSGRSTRPPRDPFNSLLSYGYSILFRNIIGTIERHGLHPYFAFMHQLRNGHAALASDLIEEYRAPLVDALVVRLVNSGEVKESGFYQNDAGAIYMTHGVMQKMTDELADIIATSRRYFYDCGDNKLYGFQAMMDKKLMELTLAIEARDPALYHPYIWRPCKDG